MIDVANYRTMIDQYNVLKEEVGKIFTRVIKRNYAIALSKIDGYLGENLEEDIKSLLMILV